MLRPLFLSLLGLVCAGCAFMLTPEYNPEYSMQLDHAKLMRLYRTCIEQHYGDPDAIAKNCEPIVAPLRIRGLESR